MSLNIKKKIHSLSFNISEEVKVRLHPAALHDSLAPAAIAVFSDLPQSDSSARGPTPLLKAGLPVPMSLLGDGEFS